MAGAVFEPSCTKRTSPARICACVKLVIATPGAETSSKWPLVAPTVNTRLVATSSTSVAFRLPVPIATVVPSFTAKPFAPITGASLTALTVTFTTSASLSGPPAPVWPQVLGE